MFTQAQLDNFDDLVPQQTTSLKQAAHAALKRGFHIFPLQPRGKKPLQGSSGFKDATTDRSQVDAWWDAVPDTNIGVATGESNLAVLDFDNGDDLPEWLRDIRTLKVKTSRGIHVYFLGARDTANMYDASGKHIGEIKSLGGYVLAASSVHPHGPVYTIVDDSPVCQAPAEIETLLKDTIKKPPTVDGDKIAFGSHDTELTRIAGKLRQIGMSEKAIADALKQTCIDRCENYGSDALSPGGMCEKIAKSVSRYEVGKETFLLGGKPVGPVYSEPVDTISDVPEPPDENSETAIPPFDSSVINGIYAKFVELICRGTTLAPQYAYVLAKTIVGARMAGKVKFENLDVEPRYYSALIGETGSGKGEAWRRTFQILRPEGAVITCGLKVINSADSGAGLKDVFFEIPEHEPVVCYVDEIQSLGNKAKDTRNPGILDAMIELADSTSVSRVLAKSKGGSKTKHDARLSMVMCGQDGLTYTKALAGQTKVGLWDRLYPEFGVPQETGDLPPVNVMDAVRLLSELNSLDYSGAMDMSTLAKAQLDEFWNSQAGEVRKKARWKKNLILDAYMSAFGRRRRTVEPEDVAIAVKIFTRQLVIRRVCFTTEVPDRTGYYIGLIKRIVSQMERRLAAGVAPELVAKSRRDFETETHAFRDNETHIFARAWQVHSAVYLSPITIKKANGQTYMKYVPSEE